MGWEWIMLAGALFVGAVLGTLYRIARTSSSADSKAPLQDAPRDQTQNVGQRVLVVDDSATIRKVIELTLLQSPFQVVEAGTDAEARKLLKTNVFALAVIDAHLSEWGGGSDLTRFCRRVAPQTPILMLHGQFEPEVDKSLGFSEETILKKPFDAKELLARVQRLTGTDSSS